MQVFDGMLAFFDVVMDIFFIRFVAFVEHDVISQDNTVRL